MGKTAIIGANGSMGRRYAAVLDYLQEPYIKFDVDDWMHARTTIGVDRIILCSPTDCHMENLEQFRDSKIPILCEKPVTKSIHELNTILDWDLNLTMVNQYAYIEGVLEGFGDTYYDFYNTGKDGLEWDCLNIIGLAGGKVFINNKSPVWQCEINGTRLNLDAVNHGYIEMVKDWIANPKRNTEYIREVHKKVTDGKYVKGTHSDTSAVNQQPTSGQVQHGDKRQDDVGMGNRSRTEVSAIHKQGEPGTGSTGSVVNPGHGQAARDLRQPERPNVGYGTGTGRINPIQKSGSPVKPGLSGADNK